MTKEENIKAIIENISEDVFYREFLTYAEQNEWEKYLTNIINCIIEKENKRLQEQIDKNLDELIKLEEMLLDYQGRLSLIKIHIKRLETLCVKDGCSFVNLIEVIKILDMIKGGNNE